MNIGRVVKGIDFTALTDEKSQKVIEFLNTLEFGISTRSGTVTQYVSYDTLCHRDRQVVS
jgi:hypothetical protein